MSNNKYLIVKCRPQLVLGFLIVLTSLIITNSEIFSQSTLLHQNPVYSISKSGQYICAGFGKSILIIDSLTDWMKKVDVGKDVTFVFPLPKKSWGLITQNEVYVWNSQKKSLKQIYKDSSNLKFAKAYKDKIIIAKRSDIIEISIDGTKNRKIGSIFGDINSLGIIEDDLIVFGNGVNVFSLKQTDSKPIFRLKSHWGGKGCVNQMTGEIIVSGGGWAPLIMKWPNPINSKQLKIKSHAAYDHVEIIDVDEDGQYWFLSTTADEGSIDPSRNIIRNYPKNLFIEVSKIIINDFLVVKNKVFLGTTNGLVTIDLKTKTVNLLQLPSIKEFSNRLKEEPIYKTKITCETITDVSINILEEVIGTESYILKK